MAWYTVIVMVWSLCYIYESVTDGDAHNGVNTMVNVIVTGSGGLGHKGVVVYGGV